MLKQVNRLLGGGLTLVELALVVRGRHEEWKPCILVIRSILAAVDSSQGAQELWVRLKALRV